MTGEHQLTWRSASIARQGKTMPVLSTSRRLYVTLSYISEGKFCLVRGYIDHLNHRAIQGWLAGENDDAPRLAQVFADGREIGSVLASRHRSDLAELGIANGTGGFEFEFPPGSIPLDRACRIEVKDKETGALLPCRQPMLDSLFDTFGTLPPVFVSEIVDVRWTDRSVTATLRFMSASSEPPVPRCQPGRIISSTIEPQKTSPGLPGYFFTVLTLEIETPEETPLVDVSLVDETADARAQATSKIRLFASAPDYLNTFGTENMERVNGKGLKRNAFVANGAHIVGRMYNLIHHATGRDISQFNNILDWGGGCGRVSVPMRRFFLPQANRITNVDVD
ncbi:hypothetical protein AADZ90_021175 [Aestuariibius sp. 2305UL40-4]|uniref:hypothetical protein n=1 Tax=Aestuariibius violaceus TaxID=3234132 RepID=UPI00348EFF20